METTLQPMTGETQGLEDISAYVVGSGQTRGTTPQRAAIYVRVASAQAGSIGIAMQRVICAEYAAAPDFVVMHVFEDVGASGMSLEREGLTALRAAVQRGEVDVVLIMAPDRLARRLDDLMALLIEFDQCGVVVQTVREGVGNRIGTEWRLVMGEVDPATVRRIFELYTTGDGDGPLPFDGIAERLNQAAADEPLRVALYARAASKDARTAQLDRLQAAALTEHWTVVLVAEDETSGVEQARLGLATIRDAALSGALDRVLVTSLDRLMRSAHELAALQAELQAVGCAIVVASAEESGA